MANIINHDVRVVDGKTIYMPPWVEDQEIWGSLALPDLSTADSVQKYPIGTKYVEGDRVYRYAKAGAAITRTDVGHKNGLSQGINYRAVSAQAIGDKTVTVTCASPDGAAETGTIVKDEFAGGYILFFTAGSVASWDKQVRLITGNTAGTTSIVFTFDRGLEIALVAGESIAEGIASPYSKVLYNNTAGYPVIGVPSVLATIGQFLWIQTWGPCWLSLQAGCGVAGQLGVIFRTDGSLSEALSAVADQITNQHAGFVLAESTTQTQGAPIIFLQITP